MQDDAIVTRKMLMRTNEEAIAKLSPLIGGSWILGLAPKHGLVEVTFRTYFSKLTEVIKHGI